MNRILLASFGLVIVALGGGVSGSARAEDGPSDATPQWPVTAFPGSGDSPVPAPQAIGLASPQDVSQPIVGSGGGGPVMGSGSRHRIVGSGWKGPGMGPSPQFPAWPLGAGGGPGTAPPLETGGAPEMTPGAAAATGTAAAAAVAGAMAAPGPALSSGLGGGLAERQGVMNMIGDLGPISVRQQFPSFPSVPGVPPPSPPHVPPTTPSPARASSLVPSVRGLKISENQSPLPQDRVYFTFDYFDNLNAKINKDFESPLGNLQAYRYIFGFEKTFDDGWGSIGLRFPIDTISAKSVIPVKFNTLAGTFTAVNDLSIIGKYVIRRNVDTGSIVSAGLVVTPPTGPRSFAGAPFLNTPHTISFQPYLGYIWNFSKRWTLHGFSAFDFPADPNLVTIMYNDVGLIYYAYRKRRSRPVPPDDRPDVRGPRQHPIQSPGRVQSQ